MNINCIYRDTSAVNDIKNAVSVLVGERISDGKSVSFPAIYTELRDAGLEIDAESAGVIYNELYGGYNDAILSSRESVEEFVGKDVEDQMKALVEVVAGNSPATRIVQIGKLPPEKQVASMIAGMFQQSEFEGTQNVNSVLKQMQTLVARAAKTLLPSSRKDKSNTIHDSLNDFFDTESVRFRTLSGGINSLETLFDAVKTEVDNYVGGLAEKLDDNDADMLRQKWDNYVSAFIASGYDIMLGKSDQNKLLNEALKQVDVAGVQIVDVNDNIKWGALMEQDNPDTITAAVKTLFENGIEDEAGNIHRYSPEQAERIGNYFERLYKDKLAAVKQAKVGNNRSKNVSAKNIISDFVKDRGFINLVKDKDGKLLLTQANWDDALNYAKGKVGDKNGMDDLMAHLDTFLRGIKDSSGNSKFNDRQIGIIKKEFEQTVAAKMVPGTSIPGAMDRLIALNDLNGGKSFKEETQSALNNVVGVSGLNQATINQIQTLVQAAKQIMGSNNVSGSTSSQPLKNRGAYAFQALSQIERRIKEIVRENKIDRSNSQRIVKYIGDNLGAASTTLLINPGNVGENIVTGLASNFAETVTLLFTNPRLYKQLGKSQSDFWTAYASHVSGGVANEVIVDTDVSTDLQAGERLRLRGAANDFRKGTISSIAGAIAKVPAYAVSIFSRTFMNSFDAGFSSSLLRKKTIGSVYNALIAQGLSSKEVLSAMDSALNIDPATAQQIESQNDSIMNVLRSVGLKPTPADSAQNKRDMRLSLYEDALAAGAAISGVKVTPKLIAESAKALVESASLQAKGLGGKKQLPIGTLDFLNTVIYNASLFALGPQRAMFRAQQKFEEQGKLGAAARSQAAAELWKNTVGRFAGGIANFMALAVTATPFGFITAASLSAQKRSMLRDNPDAADVFKADPGDIRKYAEYHNLIRSMVARASMGSIAIFGYILSQMGSDDEDETFVTNLMQTKSGRRLLQKYAPMGLNMAMALLHDVDDKKLDNRWKRVYSVLSNTTGTSYDNWQNLKTALERAKNDKDAFTAVGRILGSTMPTVNLNQHEQITRFITTLESGFDRSGIRDVKRDEATASAIYKSAEDMFDSYTTNGLIEFILRGGKNRYSGN
jgi:hypothetical protein